MGYVKSIRLILIHEIQKLNANVKTQGSVGCFHQTDRSTRSSGNGDNNVKVKLAVHRVEGRFSQWADKAYCYHGVVSVMELGST